MQLEALPESPVATSEPISPEEYYQAAFAFVGAEWVNVYDTCDAELVAKVLEASARHRIDAADLRDVLSFLLFEWQPRLRFLDQPN